MAKTFQEGDIGTRIELQIVELDDSEVEQPVDLTGLLSQRFYFQRPGGQMFDVEPSLTSPSAPTDGLLYYATESGDLTPAGTWQLQGKVQLADGTWRTRVVSFEVLGNLNGG